MDKVTQYINGLHQNMLDHFQSASIGTPIVAQIGGSNTEFRKSDNVGYISDIFASEPQSYVQNYFNDLNELRAKFALPKLSNDEVKAEKPDSPVVNNSSVLDETMSNSISSSFFSDPFGLLSFAQTYATNVAFWSIGLILLIGGFLLLAYQNDTIRKTATSAVKAVA